MGRILRWHATTSQGENDSSCRTACFIFFILLATTSDDSVTHKYDPCRSLALISSSFALVIARRWLGFARVYLSDKQKLPGFSLIGLLTSRLNGLFPQPWRGSMHLRSIFVNLHESSVYILRTTKKRPFKVVARALSFDLQHANEFALLSHPHVCTYAL